MVDVVCLEYALADIHNLLDIVTADGNDAIVFPHIDSCVGIVFLHAGGKATAGHVSVASASGQMGEEVSLTEMIGRMRSWTDAAVERVIAIGHPTWSAIVRRVLAADQDLNTVTFADHCSFNNPIDVFVELGTGKLRVQAWQADHGRLASAAPARREEWLLDQAL